MAENNEILELPHENIKKRLEELIRSEGFVKYKIEVSSGSKQGDNYAGIVRKIAVKGSKENGEEGSLSLFSKIPVEMVGFREEDESNECFLRENKFYDEIIKELKAFETEKLIEDGFTSYAKCFATGSVNYEEFLIMEDLTKRNFAMFDRFKQIDLKHVTLVMKALGKLHAISFGLRDQKPDVLKKYSKELTDVLFRDDREFMPLFKKLVDFSISKMVDKLQFEGIYQEKWENFHNNYYSLMINCCIGKLAEPYAVITHGDCWNNNMMFKYENGLPTEVCLLDWQGCRYASPILDLVYYIFCSTEKPLRDKYYNTLLNIYYDTLSNHLRNLGSDPEKLFPYFEFQNHLKRYGKYGVGMACLAIPIMVIKEEDAVDIAKMTNAESNNTANDNTVSAWTTRVVDILRDAVDLGYL